MEQEQVALQPAISTIETEIKMRVVPSYEFISDFVFTSFPFEKIHAY